MSKRVILHFAVILVCLMALSCQTFTSKSRDRYAINVTTEAPLTFSGKGAGAGMMMSSSMGPMGIAIGVAIDVGIAKKISAGLADNNFAVERAFETALRDALSGGGVADRALAKTSNEVIEVKALIQQWGFKVVPGDDMAGPVMVGEMRVAGRVYPFDSQMIDPEGSVAAAFDAVTTDGEVAAELLMRMVERVIDSVISEAFDNVEDQEEGIL